MKRFQFFITFLLLLISFSLAQKLTIIKEAGVYPAGHYILADNINGGLIFKLENRQKLFLYGNNFCIIGAAKTFKTGIKVDGSSNSRVAIINTNIKNFYQGLLINNSRGLISGNVIDSCVKAIVINSDNNIIINNEGAFNEWGLIINGENNSGENCIVSFYGDSIQPNNNVINIVWLKTRIKEQNNIINNFLLHQNHPNPFNPVTTISYQLSQAVQVELTVYNIAGQKVATLVNEKQSASEYRIQFNASNLPSGTYIYQLRAGDFVQTKKMILLK